MGNGNVLRVVGRDARGRESIDLARAARFVREHATELGVGATLLGGAILAGTFHRKRAVPTEPVNEFDLHMPRPVPAPVAPLPVPAPNVAKVEISDEPSRNPVSGYRQQSLRSEADAWTPHNPRLPAPKAEQAQPKEEWRLEEVHAKLETPVSAFSDPPKSAGVSSGSTFLDRVNAAKAAAETKRAADMKNVKEKLDEERKEREERIEREKPARDEEARRQRVAREKEFEKAFSEAYVDDLTEVEESREEPALKAAFAFFNVELKARPSTNDIEALEKAMRDHIKKNHPDKIRGDEKKLAEAQTILESAKAHYKVIQNSKRLSHLNQTPKSFGNNMFGKGVNVRGSLGLGADVRNDAPWAMKRAAAYGRAPSRGFV
jgi:hypothetical protein